MSLDTKPSLQALSHALRHPKTWPAGFVWNFANCDSCAAELAHRLWASIPASERADCVALTMMSKFEMSYDDAAGIFMGDGSWAWVPGGELDAVTPEMVADQIDAYLARQR